MFKKYTRISDKELQEVVRECATYSEVVRKLGRTPTGSNISNISFRCKKLGIDVSHMTGKSHARGKESKRRFEPQDWLTVRDPSSRRVEPRNLRDALLAVGVPYECCKCGISEWCNNRLVLEVDHINDMYWDNRAENLQLLCPNCHSQKTLGA